MPCINWTVLVCGHKWTGVGWDPNKRIFKLHKNWYIKFMNIRFSPGNCDLNMADRSEYNFKSIYLIIFSVPSCSPGTSL